MFRTELHAIPSIVPVTYGQPVLTIGSCFSQCMGDLLERYKFSVLPNPFGTVYNPLSIHKLLRRALEEKAVEANELVEYQGIYSHYDFHSSFSGTDPDQVVASINARIRQVSGYLNTCEHIIMTYGTASVYLENGRLVSNCHKHPGNWFDREFLTPGQIVEDFRKLRGMLPDKHVILTVSPVRHVRDTLPLNNVSKSILRYAAHLICTENAGYFPSYEIMMDDLRDYRFYDRDLIHPSPVAEEYIWAKFQEVYLSPEDQALVSRTEALLKRMAHRPNHPDSPNYRTFLERMLNDAQDLAVHIDLTEEIKQIRRNLNALL